MQSTKSTIEAYYQAFNEKDWNRFLELLDDNVIHDICQGEREVGKAKFKAFLDRMNTCYDEHLSKIVIMESTTLGRAAAEFEVTGKYLKSDAGLPPAKGQTYRLPGGAFFEVANGKVTRISNHYNLNDWIAQVK